MRKPGASDARATATLLTSAVLASLLLLGGATPALAGVVTAPAEGPVTQPGPDEVTAPELPQAEVVARSTLTPGLVLSTGCTSATVHLPSVGPVTWWVDAAGRSAVAGATSVPVDPAATTEVRAVLSQGASFTDGAATAVWTVGPDAELDTRCTAPATPDVDVPTGETPGDPETPDPEAPDVEAPDVEAPAAGTPAAVTPRPRTSATGPAPSLGTVGTGSSPHALHPDRADGSKTRPAPTTEPAVAVRAATAAPAALVPAAADVVPWSALAGSPAETDRAAVSLAATEAGATVLRARTGRAASGTTVDVAAASTATPATAPDVQALLVALLLTGGFLLGRQVLRVRSRTAPGIRPRD